MLETKKFESIIHFPQLDTVLMVEEFIKDNSGEFKKKSLWQNLPKKMMYQTFCVVLDYLTDSKKIVKDKEGNICWIWDLEGVERFLSKPHLKWKK